MTSSGILLPTSGTAKKGNEGKKELSGPFLVEISVIIDLMENNYLKVKCTYIQLVYSQYNPFQTYVGFQGMTFRIHSTTIPLKTVRRKNDCI